MGRCPSLIQKSETIQRLVCTLCIASSEIVLQKYKFWVDIRTGLLQKVLSIPHKTGHQNQCESSQHIICLD